MNALTVVFVSLCVFAIAYRFYGLFLANKVLCIKEARLTPAVTLADGHDYHKTNRHILFGHHFAAIAAAGPLLGPVLAAQYGYLPGALWIIIGAVLAGGVHDMVVLFASVRHKGHSLAKIAESEVGKVAGAVASVAILFILVLTLAGLAIAVVNAMFESAWGTFTVFATMPIALLMGVYLYKIRPGDVKGASVIGVVLLFITILCGPYIAANPTLSAIFTLSKKQLSLILPLYGIVASALPVWLLLCPRDYLSTYLKIGAIAMFAVGVLIVRPEFHMAAVTRYIGGGGPIIPGAVYPFVLITIACGALSGFHAIIGTGTTPKMIGSERDILFVGYGAMLVEGFVAIMALVAACVLMPGDYFGINVAPAVFEKLGIATVELPALAAAVGENVQGRPGGAVSLAIGMAYIFSAIPFMKGLMSYWYHFIIMFEAVFILTAVDTGTRVGRFLLQEMVGKAFPRFLKKRWWPGIIVTSVIFTSAWGYLVYTGDITTIWPLFGMSNQLLASCALLISTTMLLRMNKGKYALLTAIPGVFMALTTMYAGYLTITLNYLPKEKYLLATLSLIIMALVAILFVATFRRCYALLHMHGTVVDRHGDQVLQLVEE